MVLGVQGLKPEAQEQQRAGRSAREIGDDLIAQAMAMSGDFVATLNQNFLTSNGPGWYMLRLKGTQIQETYFNVTKRRYYKRKDKYGTMKKINRERKAQFDTAQEALAEAQKRVCALLEYQEEIDGDGALYYDCFQQGTFKAQASSSPPAVQLKARLASTKRKASASDESGFEKKTVKQLRALCKRRKLDVKGKKTTLVERLQVQKHQGNFSLSI